MKSRFPVVVLALLIAVAGAAAGQVSAPGATEREQALNLEQKGQFAEAETSWKSLLQSHPRDAEAYAHIGYLESQQQHYPAAVQNYRRAVALDPTMPGLQMNLGLALFKSGRTKEAAAAFLPLYRESRPQSQQAQRLRLLLGMAFYAAGEYKAAVPYLRAAMARDPQNLPYRMVLAQSCMWSKQYRCALKVYHQILNLNADSAEADMLAGEAYDGIGDHEDAIAQFRNAIKENPRLPDAHFGLGYILWSVGRFADAAPEFELEVENTPDDAKALAYWADSDVHLNRPEQARSLIERALKLNSREELPWLDLGIIDTTAHRNDEALHAFKEAESLAPGDVRVHWRLARLYQAMGEPELARAEFAKTKSLNKSADDSVFQKLHAQSEETRGSKKRTDSPDPQP